MLYILLKRCYVFLTKIIPTATYAQQTILRKFAGFKNSIRGHVVRPHWLNQTMLMHSSIYTLRGLLCMQACENIHKA